MKPLQALACNRFEPLHETAWRPYASSAPLVGLYFLSPLAATTPNTTRALAQTWSDLGAAQRAKRGSNAQPSDLE